MNNTIRYIFIGCIALILSNCAVVAVGAISAAAGTTAVVATDPRNSGSVISDNTIATKLQLKFAQNYPDGNIYVNSYNGVVLLTGQVPSSKIKKDIEFSTKTTPNVKQIYNYLEVRLPQSFTSRSNDSLTTTQIKTKLIGLKDISSNRIKIITTNNTVYLFGIITKPEARAISGTAASVNGVTKVVTFFEYINS
jgi:osmotically-inducible protein OsmY